MSKKVSGPSPQPDNKQPDKPKEKLGKLEGRKVTPREDLKRKVFQKQTLPSDSTRTSFIKTLKPGKFLIARQSPDRFKVILKSKNGTVTHFKIIAKGEGYNIAGEPGEYSSLETLLERKGLEPKDLVQNAEQEKIERNLFDNSSIDIPPMEFINSQPPGKFIITNPSKEEKSYEVLYTDPNNGEGNTLKIFLSSKGLKVEGEEKTYKNIEELFADHGLHPADLMRNKDDIEEDIFRKKAEEDLADSAIGTKITYRRSENASQKFTYIAEKGEDGIKLYRLQHGSEKILPTGLKVPPSPKSVRHSGSEKSFRELESLSSDSNEFAVELLRGRLHKGKEITPDEKLIHDKFQNSEHLNTASLITNSKESEDGEITEIEHIYVDKVSSDAQKQLREIQKLNLKNKLILFKKVILGVKKLHDKQIVHRDLKPENILLELNAEHPDASLVQVADFGLARSFNKELNKEHGFEHQEPPKPGGTKVYTLPRYEHFGQETFEQGQESDIFSLGLILNTFFRGDEDTRLWDTVTEPFRFSDLPFLERAQAMFLTYDELREHFPKISEKIESSRETLKGVIFEHDIETPEEIQNQITDLIIETVKPGTGLNAQAVIDRLDAIIQQAG